MTGVLTHLFIRSTRSWFIASNGLIAALDNSPIDERVQIAFSSSTSEEIRPSTRKAGAVVSADVDSEGRWLVTAGNDKIIRVWAIEDGKGLRVLSEREAPKKPTCLRLTGDAQTILVSDKFGDVHSFPLFPLQTLGPPSSSNAEQKRTLARSHPTLLLGHVSLLTTFTLTPDERYIITADRDEHVRVSWYPQGYVIERMCLGHVRFVSALHIPLSSPSHLLSAGGDPMIKVWNWMSGRIIANAHVEESVRPFIRVLRKRVSGREDGDDDEEGPGSEAGNGKAKLGKKLSARQRRRANKRARKAAEEVGDGNGNEAGGMQVVQEEQEDEGEEDKTEGVEDEMDVDQAETPAKTPLENAKLPPPPPLEPLLAIHKFESVNSGDDTRSIVFSAIGATAIFSFAYPACLSAQSWSSTSEAEDLHPEISHINFGKPVLNFVRVEGPKNEDEIWVLLDVEWREEEGSDQEGHVEAGVKMQMVQIVKVVDGKLHLTAESSIHPSLLHALNNTPLPPPISSENAPSDLYALLSILPKPTHVVQSSQSQTQTHHQAVDAASTAAGDAGSAGRPLSAKERGRLKSKLAVMAKRAEVENGAGVEDVRGGVRESKKAKVDEVMNGSKPIENIATEAKDHGDV